MCTPVRFRWLTSCWTIWFLSLLANPVHAQFKVLTDLDIRISDGDELALFFEWDGSDAVEAFAVCVPDGWTVLDAATSDDRGQFVPASLEPSSADESLWFVRSMDGQVIQAGQDVRLAIQTGNAVTSLIRVAPASIRDGNLVLSGRDETEMRFSWSHNILFDPAGSNLFVSFLAEGGKFDLLEWEAGQQVESEAGDRSSTKFTGGVVWIRSGLQIERPGFQFAPYLSIPVRQWTRPTDDWPRSRARIGLRFMVR